MRKTLTTYKSTKPFTFKQKEGFSSKQKHLKNPMIAIYCFISSVKACQSAVLGLFKQLKVLYYTIHYIYKQNVEKDVKNQTLT
jgi:hypothetical protein